MGRNKFDVREAFLFRNKPAAQRSAETLRKKGYRAIVKPSSKITQERSPTLKWVVFRGQRRGIEKIRARMS